MADQRTMDQLLQAPTEGYEDAIVVPTIIADNFELKHGLLTLVQNKQFFGHDKEDPHAHVRYFNKITSTLKFLNIPNTSIKLMLFPFSLKGVARIWPEKEPPRSIFTWDDLVLKFTNQFFPPSKTTNHRNEIINFQQRFDESFNQDSLDSVAGGNFLDKMPRECLATIESKYKVRYSRNKPVVAKVISCSRESSRGKCVTCGGAHSYGNCLATDGNVYRDNIQEFVSQASAVNYNQGNTIYRPPMMSNQIRPPGVSKEDFLAYIKANDAVMRNMQTQGQNMQNQLTNLTDLITKFMNSNSASTSNSGALPSNTIANPRSDLNAITTQSGVSYDRPQIPPSTSFLPKVVEDEPEARKDTVNPTNNGSTKEVQPQPNPKSLIPYPSRRNDERNHEKTNNQFEKFYQIFEDISFKISFADALILMPKFASTLKALIGNKEKLSEITRTSLNEYCSMVLLKKLPKKLGDPGKFLIPCDSPGLAECLALADLGASINLMPFFVWKRLYLLDLKPTCMTLELADRSISHPVGVAEDIYVKVGWFNFSADFVVVDFDADPRVPLILGRSFLKTEIALIDVFEGELTLRVGKKAITFNLDQTSRYSANYSDMTAKRIDVIDMACEEYSQEVLGFSDIIASSNPTLYCDPIVFTTSSTLTLLISTLGGILLLEAFLNDDPSLPPLNQGNYLPEVRKELKICEAKSKKSSVDEPLEVELKDLPPHLEYAFLECDDKLPVKIAKDLSMEEKTALITVLKSHKRAIAWKLYDIKGIDPEFCTHKILIEEDFEPSVQHQRRVNPKIHDVIKQEVIKLLKAGFIYPIFDSPWVSLVHCVPTKGGFTVVKNEDNELIPTRLVTGKFQRCMMAIFHDMIEKTMDVFMDDFSVFGNSFQSCLSYLERMLKRCEDTNLCLNWEKSHFMVKEGIVLGHKICKQRIKVDKEKVDVITKLPHPTTVKARPMTRLLKKDTPFIFSQECVEAFQTLKRKLTEAPILIALDWDMPFELMCDASDFAIGAENLAADHLSRLENPHQNVLDPKEINESFPLKTLNLVSTHGNQSTPWFADFANYHAENFIVKGMSSQQKSVYQARKPLKSSRLATMDPRETSGQVEMSNRGLKCILERAVGENRASWSDKLDDALWAFRTIGCTPYKLVYKKACHLPIELEHKAYWALKHANFDLKTAGDHKKV
uniref:Reverse transcriptase domain-containing protein n=1 Tax=Tanacetum cinerariifolium TaxID=118510 RepID=A0A699GMY7_TANCI|nr:reverse transcriptase domain-containing protein [Tanacetum cinerariifolium]